MEASVIIAKCDQIRKVFGVRIQRMEDGDWYRTWAFKINENVARREGYDNARIIGSLCKTEGFPGCPYCGSLGFYQCGTCQRIACWNAVNIRVICPWCNAASDITLQDSFDVKTDRF